MNKYIYILLFAVLFVNDICAQVTAGSNTPPASFSVLQLDKTTGGLRLPQISNRSLININASSTTARKELAKGLMIYNTNTGWVEYWDGISWTPITQSLYFGNGLSAYTPDGLIGLGGSLTRNTTINLNGNNLNFLTSTATTSKFTVNDDVFTINNRNILFKPTRFSVNTNLFSITGDAIISNPYVGGTGVFTMKSVTTTGTDTGNSLAVTNGNVAIAGKLTYKDNGDNSTNGHVLVSSSAGVGYWASLKPETNFQYGTVNTSATVAQTTNSNRTIIDTYSITSAPLVLTEGKWMIFVYYATTSTGTANYYVWTRLYQKPDSGSKTLVTTMGKPTSTNDTNKATFPDLVFVVDVTERTEFTLECGTRNAGTQLTTAYGEPYFFGMSIIEPGK